MPNTKHLRKRGNSWSVVKVVPSHIQNLVGKREIVKALGTRDLEAANRVKYQVLADIEHSLRPYELEWEKKNKPDKAILKEALERSATYDPAYENISSEILNRADDLEAKHGYELAKNFHDVATRKVLTVGMLLPEFIEQATGVSKKHRDKMKMHISIFIQKTDDPLIKNVDRRMAATFMRWRQMTPLPTTGNVPSSSTMNQWHSSLMGLWKWARAVGYLEDNHVIPWEGMLVALPGQKKEKIGVKELRPVTLDEAQHWIENMKEQAQVDLAVLSWHTGVRPRDLCSLTKDRIKYMEPDEDRPEMYLFTFTEEGKTEANARIMPVISPEAVQMLNYRLSKCPSDRLFFELPEDDPEGPFHLIGKRTNNLRRKLFGDNDTAPFDFYSFRRHFSAACEDAGLDPVQWSRLMGHTAPTLAAAVYNKGHHGLMRMLKGVSQIEKEIGELGWRKMDCKRFKEGSKLP